MAPGTKNEIKVASPLMLAACKTQVSGPRRHKAAVTQREIIIRDSLLVDSMGAHALTGLCGRIKHSLRFLHRRPANVNEASPANFCSLNPKMNRGGE
jgi:hypothetical protein